MVIKIYGILDSGNCFGGKYMVVSVDGVLVWCDFSRVVKIFIENWYWSKYLRREVSEVEILGKMFLGRGKGVGIFLVC